MKHIIRLSLLLMFLTFGGCYTVLWSPEEPLPPENNSQIYYSEPYYGEYNYYYDYPWWIIGRQDYISPAEGESASRSSTGSAARDNNGFRTNPGNSGSIIRNDSPSRSSQPNDNSGTVSKTRDNNNSNNPGGQTRSSENSRTNEGNNSARNNNGIRSNTGNSGSIIRNDTPSRSSQNNNDSSGSVSKTSDNNNSSNSGGQTRSAESSRSNEGNNSARNNNGNRNSGNGRR